ncbi:MAG: ABC-2 transporter permease [Firmicutes bacterium]|nr:ABC-2 transporter permease [Bacillota bacterium]
MKKLKNINALLKLDVQLIKPYWPWLLMFFGLALLMGIMMGEGFGFIISWTIFAGTILAFPFENKEKGNMDMLFASLPTNRKSMIFAKYASILIGLGIALIIGLGVAILLDMIYLQFPLDPVYVEGIYIPQFRAMELDIYWSMMLTMTALAVAIYMISVGVQTPFFYKYGYKKGRIFMWIPIILITVVLNLQAILGLFNIDFNIFNIMLSESINRIITSCISLGIGVLAFIGSYFLSRKMYLKKDI